jgi:hypothetical protein
VCAIWIERERKNVCVISCVCVCVVVDVCVRESTETRGQASDPCAGGNRK